MWTISWYFTIPQAMDGCGIRAAAACAFALVISTAAACSLTAAAFVRAITFVVDLLLAAASLQVIALMVDFLSAGASVQVITSVVDLLVSSRVCASDRFCG